ncbi:hypothetical protein JVU11DRAFT_139 [Chiua virens]|nr:hypothetical protein JVU11DRAFT_139 [Chiua virens]
MVSLLETGLDFAALLSISIEGVLYGESSIACGFSVILTVDLGAIGISLMLFCGTMWTLTHGRSEDDINWSMVLVAVILTISSTVVSLRLCALR